MSTVSTPAGTSPTIPADQVSYGPAVTQVEPDRGLPVGGTPVAIIGAGFIGATAVKFGTTDATSFTVNTAGSITAISPPGAGTVDVTVTTAAGTSAENPADEFSYEAVALEETPLTTGGDSPPGALGSPGGGSGLSSGGAHERSLAGTVSNAFVLNGMESVAARGTVKLTLTLPGPGTIQILGKTSAVQLAAASRTKKKRTAPVVIVRLRLTVSKAGRIVVTLVPTGRAKTVLARRSKLRATVTITYTPTGGAPRSIVRIVTFRLKRQR